MNLLSDYEPRRSRLLYLTDGSDNSSALQYLFTTVPGAVSTDGDENDISGFKVAEDFDAITVQWLFVKLTATGFVAVSVDQAIPTDTGAFEAESVVALRGQLSAVGSLEDSSVSEPVVVFRRGRRVRMRAFGASGASNSSIAVARVTAWRRKDGRQ